MLKRHNEKFAVVGGGIAGVCTSALLAKRGYNVTLFEKHSSLGGCAGSFERNGYVFNVGATTIPGLLPEYPVSQILSELDVLSYVEIIEPAILIHTPRGIIRRYLSLQDSISELNRVFPHKNNKKFWELVYKVTKEVLTYEYYHNFSYTKDVFFSFLKMKELILKYYKLFFKPASKGLYEYFGTIDSDYYNFMDAHVKIIAQSSIEEVNMLTLLLCLGYPFTGVGLAKEGMGSLFQRASVNCNCKLNSEITSIKKNSEGYILESRFGKEFFDRLIISMPILENLNILEDCKIKSYFEKYLKLLNDNSALVLYGVIKDFNPENPFHLCILKKALPFTTSSYLFFSFSNSINDRNERTFTISTHTTKKYWINLNREDYDKRKEMLQSIMIESTCRIFNIGITNIKMALLATPESFYRYLGRRSVGGIPITRKNTFWRIPSNFTPFSKLYLVGDNFFCYQGWLGISIGIKNLIKHIDEKI